MTVASGRSPGGHRLRRELGLAQITASGVGIIIGAGIYVLLGAATEQAGAGVWVSFALAGALSALTALSYAELAAMFPSAGAEFDYTRHAAPAAVAFVVGWVMIVGLLVAAAAVALGFGEYLRHFVEVPAVTGALVLLVAVGITAFAGIRRSALITVLFSAVQIGGLVLVIVIGAFHVGDHSVVGGASTGGIVSAAALVFFAFIGFDEVITLSEETRDPVRTIPRGLLLALGISTLLYMAVAVAGVSVLGADQLARSDQPLATVIDRAVGGGGADVIAAIALVATANTTLLCITASSRLVYGMAGQRALPPAAGRVSRRGVPWVGVSLAIGGAALVTLLGDITLVASVTDFAVYLVFIAVNVVVIALRQRQPRRYRPFRVPLSIGPVPIPTVAGLLLVLVLLPRLDTTALALGAAVTIVGLGVHLVLSRWMPSPTTAAGTVELGDNDDVHRRTVTTAEAEAVLAALHLDPDAVPWDVEQFRMGLESELGHGRVDPDTNVTDDDLVITGRIALAHLVEIPDYYTRLAAMEAEAFEARDHGR
jgi:APA family basic amino acid/polyamine antiporter